MNSIKKFGLISPVVVIEKKDSRFELIVGQRRYLAFQKLGEKNIPAIVIGDISDSSKRIISFAENMHRRELNFNDTVAVCEALFKKYSGDEKEKISKISRDIGISIPTVSTYLGYQLIPEEVRKLVEEGKINRTQASKITTTFWPDTNKIIALAKKMQGYTRSEWKRALDYSKKKSDAPINEILAVAEKPATTVKIQLEIEKEHLVQLRDVAKKRGELLKRQIDPMELIEQAVVEFLERAGLE